MDIVRCIDCLLRDGFVLVFNQDKLDVVRTAYALAEAGISNMEVTCRIQKPLEKIKKLRKEMPEFVIGAASLIDHPELLKRYDHRHRRDPLPSVDQAIDSGADYLVSAMGFREESYSQYAKEYVMIPGCGTVGEIVEQYARGAHFCKVFPVAQLGGAGFIRAIDPAIHKIISLIPTGGTSLENMSEYISAGVLVLGGSFSMIEEATLRKIIDQQDYTLLGNKLQAIKEQIDKLRGAQWPTINWSRAGTAEIGKITGRDFNTVDDSH